MGEFGLDEVAEDGDPGFAVQFLAGPFAFEELGDGLFYFG